LLPLQQCVARDVGDELAERLDPRARDLAALVTVRSMQTLAAVDARFGYRSLDHGDRPLRSRFRGRGAGVIRVVLYSGVGVVADACYSELTLSAAPRLSESQVA
jgi:hypothetical protein